MPGGATFRGRTQQEVSPAGPDCARPPFSCVNTKADPHPKQSRLKGVPEGSFSLDSFAPKQHVKQGSPSMAVHPAKQIAFIFTVNWDRNPLEMFLFGCRWNVCIRLNVSWAFPAVPRYVSTLWWGSSDTTGSDLYGTRGRKLDGKSRRPPRRCLSDR